MFPYPSSVRIHEVFTFTVEFERLAPLVRIREVPELSSEFFWPQAYAPFASIDEKGIASARIRHFHGVRRSPGTVPADTGHGAEEFAVALKDAYAAHWPRFLKLVEHELLAACAIGIVFDLYFHIHFGVRPLNPSP